MIQMKTGVYGGKGNKLIRPEDGPFSLSPEKEARLVKRGVAKYVNDADETVVEGKSLDNMTVAELRTTGKELGLTLKVGMTKAAMIEAITAKMEQAEIVEDEIVEDEPVDPDESTDEDAPTFDAAEAVQ